MLLARRALLDAAVARLESPPGPPQQGVREEPEG
jgi:hypothetical protein